MEQTFTIGYSVTWESTVAEHTTEENDRGEVLVIALCQDR
jgi:hypothetical protein